MKEFENKKIRCESLEEFELAAKMSNNGYHYKTIPPFGSFEKNHIYYYFTTTKGYEVYFVREEE